MAITATYSRDGNRVPITNFGLLVTKSYTLSGTGTVVAPIFKVTGEVFVNVLYGIVTTVLSPNIRAASWRINDQSAQTYLTAVGGTTADALPVGSALEKTGLVATALSVDTSASANIGEGTSVGLPHFIGVEIQAKSSAETDIEFRFTSTDNPCSGAITFYCYFLPITDNGNVTAL